ncbi:hypothetical protein L5515_001560 [Caenorhabditis briggsae]|nr:hypothetical protein L5515_001560 [Caenorhabditis briggsae]
MVGRCEMIHTKRKKIQKLDAALESPTGTGKTLSLLCSTLAWVQKLKESKPMDFATWQSSGAGGAEKTEDKLKNSFIPTIFYASRTHSQLEQVVHELNRTEYKWVKTTILGSREHFCINQKVKKIKESNRQAHVCRGLVSKRSCHYYNKFDALTTDKANEILEKGEAMDIEDFVKIGTQNSICPYFMSRQRSETAELILLPYNYIIDPKMRRRYKLDLKNSIVIFDEAHNLESICESNASAELSSTSIALCIEELKKVLALLVEEEENAREEADNETEAFGTQKIDLTKKLIENLRTEDLMALLEKVFTLEENFDKLFESDQLKSVPPLDGKASDGAILLETLANSGCDGNSVERFVDVLRDAISYLLSKNEEVSLTEKGDGMESVADFLLSIYSTHAQEVAAAVGDEHIKLADRVDPATVARNCKLYIRKDSGKLVIKYFCFQASISMRMLKMRGVRNVLLASGTLSPIQAFTYNMGLNFGAILENEHALKQVPVLTSIVTRGKHGGLVGSFQNRKNIEYVSDVGESLIRVMETTPQGVLVFFSSYSQMDELVEVWKKTKRGASDSPETFWEKMEKTKKIAVEPRAKEQLAAVRLRYTQGVSEPHGAALLAVCRGKVSEGIDFCDAESRAVIIVGIPYPPIHDERVVLKKMYLDDLMGRKDLTNEPQSSRDWYQMEAFRAVNQAIGRVLRHKNDFGTVVLIDTRYASAKPEMFPKWLRNTISRCDSNNCALKTARFFKERGHLIENSKSEYIKKQAKTCKSFRQVKSQSASNPKDDITDITLEDMFSPANMKIEKKEKIEPRPIKYDSSSSSVFSLPTNEDELKVKKWEQENDSQTNVSSSSDLNKRKYKAETPGNSSGQHVVSGSEPPKKRKMVLLTRETLPEKYQNALNIPTSELTKGMSLDNQKQFVATLKGYKATNMEWQEVFQRLHQIFIPDRPDLFISCSNILRSEDKMKYIRRSLGMKINY